MVFFAVDSAINVFFAVVLKESGDANMFQTSWCNTIALMLRDESW